MNLSEEVFEKLKHVQDLVRKKNSNTANYEEVLLELLNLYIEKKDPVEKAKRWEMRVLSTSINEPGLPQKKTSQGSFSVEAKLTPWSSRPGKRPFKSLFLGAGRALKRKTCPGTGSIKRMPIPAAIYHQVNLRDRGKCQVCQSKKWTEIHHLQPVKRGGENTLENLATLCWQHHQVAHISRSLDKVGGLG